MKAKSSRGIWRAVQPWPDPSGASLGDHQVSGIVVMMTDGKRKPRLRWMEWRVELEWAFWEE
ncbi:hypothetical protein E2C01_071027 [Portunus trituberculatus]|uniref:Uncharacterized protein n=1 Tax=Portunus trituberculatus TaxID=210409 RepID=A0A5B7HVU6_PORTR|nr:hypothetical protein [Portunus trituberculatus]